MSDDRASGTRRLPDSVVYSDIVAQASTLPQTVEKLKSLSLPDPLVDASRSFIFTGCGSSYYAAQCAAQVLRALGETSSYAVPASEVWLLPELWLKEGTVLVGISRSGTTTEVVGAMERARDAGVPTVGISLGNNVPVKDLADVAVDLSHVDEAGRPMTQSFSSLLLAAQWLATEVSNGGGNPAGSTYRAGLEAASRTVRSRLPQMEEQARAVVSSDVGHYVFLGGGPFAGLCAEAALKVKEMSRVEAESYATMEFRHGPVAALRKDSAVVLASCETTAPFDLLVAEDVGLLEGTAITVGPEALADRFPKGTRFVKLPNGLPDWAYGILAMPFFQLLAYFQTERQGDDPNSVRFLDKNLQPHIDPHVVELEGFSQQ